MRRVNIPTKWRWVFSLALPVLAALATYSASLRDLPWGWSALTTRDPAVVYPTTLDLGSREIGDVAVAPFSITNRGGAELIIDNVHTNCSCTGMERVVDRRYEPVEMLRLKRGERADVVMRVSVRGIPVNAQMLNVVEFRTNDPHQPLGRIEAIVRSVSGGVSSDPPAVVFGTVAVGVTIRKVIEVRDTAVLPRVIKSVSTTHPDRVAVKMLPFEDSAGEVLTHRNGRLIGRFEVSVLTGTPGEVNAEARIHLSAAGRDPDAVAIVGRVAEPIEIVPSVLLLPRLSSSGPIYSGNCMCRSTRGQPLRVVVESASPGLTAFVQGDEKSAVRNVLVKWQPEHGSINEDRQQSKIRMRAEAGDDKAILELVVLLRS